MLLDLQLLAGMNNESRGINNQGLTWKLGVRPDMQYCSRSRCFHPDPGMKHISVPPRHMTMPYAPDFQHDITTLQIEGYNISYNRHTTALIQYISERYMSEYKLHSNA